MAHDATSASLRLRRRPEGVAEIRDAYQPCWPGDDPGPAGRAYSLWRRLAANRPSPHSDGAPATDRCCIFWPIWSCTAWRRP